VEVSRELYTLRIDGCDDETNVELELSPEEAVFLEEVALKVTEASSCRCQPRMTLIKGRARKWWEEEDV
jgi:hypothetical protein